MTRSGKTLALAAVPATAYVVVMALIAAIWVKPPVLGWIGFSIVALVGAALIVAAVVLLPRSRRNVETVAPASRHGVLVLADAACSPEQVRESVVRHVGDREPEVHVVAPVLADPAHYFTEAEEAGQADAERRLAVTLEELHAAGIPATGSVGADDPLQALGDAIVEFPAAELVIVRSSDSHWLEEGMLEGAHALFPSVEQIVTAPAPVT